MQEVRALTQNSLPHAQDGRGACPRSPQCDCHLARRRLGRPGEAGRAREGHRGERPRHLARAVHPPRERDQGGDQGQDERGDDKLHQPGHPRARARDQGGGDRRDERDRARPGGRPPLRGEDDRRGARAGRADQGVPLLLRRPARARVLGQPARVQVLVVPARRAPRAPQQRLVPRERPAGHRARGAAHGRREAVLHHAGVRVRRVPEPRLDAVPRVLQHPRGGDRHPRHAALPGLP